MKKLRFRDTKESAHHAGARSVHHRTFPSYQKELLENEVVFLLSGNETLRGKIAPATLSQDPAPLLEETDAKENPGPST